jgi:CRISPR-associated protein Cmx8
MAKKPTPSSVTVTYDLHALPTAQHKAGLAGLLLQIAHMNGEGKSPRPAAVPKVIAQTATHAVVEFTAEAVQCLFDDLYAATREMVRVKSKWANAKEAKPPEEIEEEVDEKLPDGTARTKKVKVKYYFYEQVQPSGHLLRQYIANGPDLWLKLWRDMLWRIPRGNPQSRKPFEERADGKPCREASSVWADLIKAHSALAKDEFHTSALNGSLWLGAQAVNAEGVPFEGRVEQTLLLHFWPLVAQVYIPEVVTPDGEKKPAGFVLAIPEVADLEDFLSQYRVMLSALSGKSRGYRPAEAIIDMPAEGALSFLEHLGRLAAASQTDIDYSSLAFSVGSVEFLHLDKKNNNTKTLSAGRVAPRPGLLAGYYAIVGKPGHLPAYGNPLFRRGLMLALLNCEPWFRPFGRLFADWDVSFFIPTDTPPRNLSRFWVDVRKKLHEVQRNMQTTPSPDKSPDTNDVIATTVSRFVQRYLDLRIQKDKPEWDFGKFRKEKRTPPEAAEARRKLAERLFLELRSRRDQAFIDYFTNTFFSVPQYFGQKPLPRMFELITTALLTDTDTVKTLTLMALSANSWIPSPTKETAQ